MPKSKKTPVKKSRPVLSRIEARFITPEALLAALPGFTDARIYGPRTYGRGLAHEVENLLPGHDEAWARYCAVVGQVTEIGGHVLHDNVEAVCWEQQAYGAATAFMLGFVAARQLQKDLEAQAALFAKVRR